MWALMAVGGPAWLNFDQTASPLGVTAPTGNQMKYEVRWSNGFWKTFDMSHYESVAVHYSQAEAVIAVSKANGR